MGSGAVSQLGSDGETVGERHGRAMVHAEARGGAEKSITSLHDYTTARLPSFAQGLRLRWRFRPRWRYGATGEVTEVAETDCGAVRQ